jgi:hypothetical protein
MSIVKSALRLPPFLTEPDRIDSNLRRKVTLGEFCALLFCATMIGISIWLHSLGRTVLTDYINYTSSTLDNLQSYYYGFWLMPLINLFHLLPLYVGYAIWGCLNVAGVWFASRVFGGRTVLALLVYQMLYTLYYGQISGLIAGALGFAWWAYTHKKWDLAGLGFLIAAAKYQSGLVVGGLLWLMAPATWRNRLRTLVVPVAGVILSIILYPGWPIKVWEHMQANPPNDFASVSLWRWIGPAALLLILPALFIPMDWRKRLVALLAASTLALPYFQQADLLVLYAFPIGFYPILGNLGFLYYWYQWDALQWLALVPLAIYLGVLLPELVKLFRRRPAPVSEVKS